MKRTIVLKQNFSRTTPMLRWTPRLQALWFFRNLFNILFIWHYLKITPTTYFWWEGDMLPYRTLIYFLQKNESGEVLNNVWKKSHSTRTSNFAKSCNYWVLKNSINYFSLCDQGSSHLPIIRLQPRPEVDCKFCYRAYVKPWRSISWFVSKKIYRITIANVINVLLYTWSALNSHRYFSITYPILLHEWQFLRFLDLYYFKIMNF